MFPATCTPTISKLSLFGLGIGYGHSAIHLRYVFKTFDILNELCIIFDAMQHIVEHECSQDFVNLVPYAVWYCLTLRFVNCHSKS
ncbi:hypothetical protein RhiirA1_466822 [Rhizophagus irregularis]|uniref:Uncharacterized protein n=1 Tax=Rhizophagus irregularis TaxID=588596 RepID=A0A2N0RD76_9GLOM|nr:hypothetical protein RhiirA1_466822 [Rhizophagus irregularis]